MNSFFSEIVFAFGGPLSTFEAATRSSLIEDRNRANTLSPISVSGMPRSSAEIAVHLPVPFCPAVSRILSSVYSPFSSLYARMSRVISIR